MNLFNKLTLSFLGLSTVILFVLATGPLTHRAVYAPKATFLPLDAVPEVVFVHDNKQKPINSVPRLVSYSFLSKEFNKINYHLHLIRAGKRSVPRLFVSCLPSDMRHIRVVEQRKELFFQSVLPLILWVNDDILAKREKLMKLSKLKGRGVRLRAVDRLWVAAMEERYDVRRGDLKELVRRMDIVPPSLALAQAAEESGWGTSRFVIEGNALFGQWTVDGDRGLIPGKRLPNRDYRVKVFDSLVDGVRAYMKNLNTHRAYRSFRAARSEMRRMGQVLNGRNLALNLLAYSERGEKYIQSLQKIIKSNRLEMLDIAKLSSKTQILEEKIADKKPVT